MKRPIPIYEIITRFIEVMLAIAAVVAAISSVKTAKQLNDLEANRDISVERVRAIEAIAEWSDKIPTATQHCFFLLNTSMDLENKDRRYIISKNVEKEANRCFEPYNSKLEFGKDNEIELNDNQKRILHETIGRYINNYDILAMFWKEFKTKEAKDIICRNMKITRSNDKKNILIYRDKVKNLNLWTENSYESLDKFIDECK